MIPTFYKYGFSNKPGKKGEREGDKGKDKDNKKKEKKYYSGYAAYRFKDKSGIVSVPRIDAITFLVDLDPEEADAMLNLLLLNAEDEEVEGFAADKSSKNIFNWSAAGAPVIFTVPKPNQKKVLRLEFSPERLKRAGIKLLKENIEILTSGVLDWERVRKTGKITRYDVAVDFIGLEPADLLFDYHDEGKRIFYLGNAGELQTVYFGKKINSPVKVYNKKLEEAEQGKSHPYCASHYTRLEITRKPKNLWLKGLSQQNSPLNKIDVFCVNRPKGISDQVWSMFLPCARYLGLKEAIALLPAKHQGLVTAQVDECKQDTWRPEKIWKMWPIGVSRYGM
jgi:hypothetical protein